MTAQPSFIAFTGVDDPTLVPHLQQLSRRYPIEWGVLIDDVRRDEALFAKPDTRARLLAAPGLRWAAHVCGEQAARIANDPETATVDLTGFQRVQVNHSFAGSTAMQVGNVIRFGRQWGVRAMLQCADPFPAEARLDWLFDVSFGTGMQPERWPALPPAGPFCGYSGGITSENVSTVVRSIAAAEGVPYWIDMESGVRTDGRFDVVKCAAVCMAVFG